MADTPERDNGPTAACPGAEVAAADAALLLVADAPESLQELQRLVSGLGYGSERALGAGQALALLEARSFPVVMLDDAAAGSEALGRVLRDAPASKLIVVGDPSDFGGLRRALQRGAVDFIWRPWGAGEVRAIIERALEQSRLAQHNRLMEQQLRESEALHRFIVNSSPDLVYMLDRDGCFTFLNDRVESLLGYRREELIGRHYSEIVHPDHHEHARNVVNERRAGHRAAARVELRLKSRNRPAGRRMFSPQGVWMEVTAMGVYRDPRERSRRDFIGTYGTARDISERKEAEEVINFQAYHDLLTRLPNRALLRDRLSLAIAQARRNGSRLAVMFLDLDRFKVVNDTLGHAMGDRLLKAVAQRLQSCLRRGDTLSRFGGDEFMLLLPEIRTRDDVEVIAAKILDRLCAPFFLDGHELVVGASIGIATYPEAGESEETLIQNADIAMYHVKGSRRNAWEFFSEAMNQQLSSRVSRERELRRALREDQLTVHYQPQIAVGSGRIVGVEALARWMHPRQGLVEPGDFLPLADETGLLARVDERVQQLAFAQVAEWRAAGYRPLRLSVNVSPLQLEQEAFVANLVAALERASLAPGMVKLEIAENTLMRDMEVILPRLRELRRLGMRIAIDDIGTGYSSLGWLQEFPLDGLKVDRSFVGDLRPGRQTRSVIDVIVAMARGLQLELLAEGVENPAQLRYLRSQGCAEVQGYLFTAPLPADQLVRLLESNHYAEITRAAS